MIFIIIIKVIVVSLCAVTFRYNFGLSSNVVEFLLCFTITHLYISFKENKNAEQMSLIFFICNGTLCEKKIRW